MSKSITTLGGAVAVSLFLSGAALAFNPQPDPPGKRLVDPSNPNLGGPDTKSKGGSVGSWSWKVPAVQKLPRRK
jgi:hypothetical protein